MLSIKALLNKMKIYIILGIIVGLIISFFIFFQPFKKDIHNATIIEIANSSSEIGYDKKLNKGLAKDIYFYLQNHPNCSIDDLDNIHLIGEKRINDLKKKFK